MSKTLITSSVVPEECRASNCHRFRIHECITTMTVSNSHNPIVYAQLLDDATHLEEISITNEQVYSKHWLEVLFASFLKMPKLAKLTFSFYDQRHLDNVVEVDTNLGVCSNLTALTLQGSKSTDYSALAQWIPTQLQVLDLPGSPTLPISTILSRCTNLQELVLDTMEPSQLSFFVLPDIRELHLSFSGTEEPTPVFEQLSYTSPNLRHLGIHSQNLTAPDLVKYCQQALEFNSPNVFTRLEQLELAASSQTFEEAQELLDLLPNLQIICVSHMSALVWMDMVCTTILEIRETDFPASRIQYPNNIKRRVTLESLAAHPDAELWAKYNELMDE